MMDLIVLKYPRLSMESLSDILKRRAPNDRLEKVFEILGKVPENMFILGYSRGKATILDMVLDAQKKNRYWYENLKGTVSLGGTNYGTEIADMLACSKPGEVTGLLVAVVESA